MTIERECCGTFKGTAHRKTCEKFVERKANLNQYALGYKAGIEAAVAFAAQYAQAAEDAYEQSGSRFDDGEANAARGIEQAIAALPIPFNSGDVEVSSGGKHRYCGSFGD